MSNYNQEKLLKHLGEKWGSKMCPMCGVNNWGVSDKAMELREFHEGSIVAGCHIAPVIPINCGNCGYMVLVNGLISEVVERPREESKKND